MDRKKGKVDGFHHKTWCAFISVSCLKHSLQGGGDRSTRNNVVRDLLLELVREALVSPKLEPKGLMDNKNRPADLLNNLEGRKW
jgi:hypothetical protein